ncbi:MAG: hypothetical protein JRD89_00785 [Deltaproteobacteria bacterium]|nr:hypothetical protein [Deltaproteobacteria bacterium]
MAKRRAIVCMDVWLKNRLAWELKGKVDQDIINQLGAIPTCENDIIAIEEVSHRSSKVKGAGTRSEYQAFITNCLKEHSGPVTQRMKLCAIKWREKKREKEKGPSEKD